LIFDFKHESEIVNEVCASKNDRNKVEVVP